MTHKVQLGDFISRHDLRLNAPKPDVPLLEGYVVQLLGTDSGIAVVVPAEGTSRVHAERVTTPDAADLIRLSSGAPPHYVPVFKLVANLDGWSWQPNGRSFDALPGAGDIVRTTGADGTSEFQLLWQDPDESWHAVVLRRAAGAPPGVMEAVGGKVHLPGAHIYKAMARATEHGHSWSWYRPAIPARRPPEPASQVPARKE